MIYIFMISWVTVVFFWSIVIHVMSATSEFFLFDGTSDDAARHPRLLYDTSIPDYKLTGEQPGSQSAVRQE